MINPDNKNPKTTVAISTSIEPWLSISDCTKAINFYKSAFGAIEVYRLEVPDGGLVVRLSVDGAEFWVSGESVQNIESSNSALPGGSFLKMILKVAEPDALFDRALKAGAIEVFPVGEEHGWRLGRLTDPFGLDWEIGRPV